MKDKQERDFPMQKNEFPSINSGILTVVPIICRNFALDNK